LGPIKASREAGRGDLIRGGVKRCGISGLTDSQCSTKDMFIRGSVVRYVHLPSGAVDTALLEDATRREAEAAKNKAK
jgi:hypothetical protein